MDPTSRLDELLTAWEERYDQGEPTSAEALCRDCPELLAELQSRIERLQARKRRAADPSGPAKLETPSQSRPDTESSTLAYEIGVRAPGPIPPPDLADFGPLEEIARGGMGVVYRVRDPHLGRDLAVKILRPDRKDRPDLAQRFIEEAKIAGQLQHPGIAPIHALGRTADGRPFFTMKLIRGQTLAALLKECPDVAASFQLAEEGGQVGNLPPHQDLPRFLKIFEQVCQTIAYVHSRGVLHRDLKPANIMVGAFGEVQVMDWGLAKTVGSEPWTVGSEKQPDQSQDEQGESLGSGRHTHAGSILGTPAYMAPEQARGEIDALDERVDVFGLGAILCEILTGKPPFAGGVAADLLRQAARGDLAGACVRLESCGADHELVAIAKKCLAPQRDTRFRDAGVLAAVVERYQVQVQERLRQAELARAAAQARAQEERKRRRLWLGLAAAVVLLVLGGSGAALWYQQDRAARVAEETERKREEERKHALAEQGIRDALAQARNKRGELHAILAKPGGAWQLLNQSTRWEGLVQSARAEWQRASDIQTGVESMIDPALAAQIEELNRQWSLDAADRALAVQLEQVREKRSAVVASKFNTDLAAQEYRLVFSKAGLEPSPGLEQTVATQIKQSAIKEALVAALDDWAYMAWAKTADDLCRRLLDTARRADPNRWRDRVRDFELWKDQKALEKLLDQARQEQALGQLSPQLVILLGGVLRHGGGDSEAWLRKAQLHHPADFWIHYDLGHDLEDKHSPDAAGCYRAALAVRPDSVAAWNHLSHVLRDQNDLPGAVDACKRALALDANAAVTWNNLGMALREQNDFAGAMEAFKKALVIDPKLAPAWTNVGYVLDDQEDLAGASDAYHKALASNKHYAPAWNNLGLVLRKQKNLADAVTAFRNALAIDKKDATYWHNLGLALHDQKDWAAARAAFQKSLALNPKSARRWNDFGSAQNHMKDLPAAIAAYKKALAIDPNYVDAWFNLGTTLEEQPDLEGAIAAYRKALAINPKHAHAWYNLGNALDDHHDLAGAIDAYKKAIASAPKYAMAWTNLGVALRKQKNLPAAIDAYKRATALDPKLFNAWSNLGLTLLEQKEKDLTGAVEALQKAVALEPKKIDPQIGLAAALFERGDFAEASAAFQRAVDLMSPSDPRRGNAQRDVQTCRHMATLEERLPLVLGGAKTTSDEQIGLAYLCQRHRQRYRLSVRLFTEAFGSEPKLVEDPTTARRYSAARAALLAAAGKDPTAKLDDNERARLRAQALDWLQADLAAFKRLFPINPVVAVTLQAPLSRWQDSADLASVRDDSELARLPKEERLAWRQLWAGVEQVRKAARDSYQETVFTGALSAKDQERVHHVKMLAGMPYVIDMTSPQFDTYLRLEDAKKKVLAENDDIDTKANNLNSRLIFMPKEDGVYRIVATSFEQHGLGTYTLTIREFQPRKK